MSNQMYVTGVPHVYQFSQGRSEYRCEAFSLAALSRFAWPTRRHWNGLANEPVILTDLNELASMIYQKYAGPDLPSNQQGMTKEQALDWFKLQEVGFYDLQSVVDACRANGNYDELRHNMASMNKSNIPVLLGIDDESYLRTPDGKKLHSWNDEGLRHCIIRLGMDMEQPITLILDPAAPCPPFAFPTPVLWSDLSLCKINTAIGIMPPGVSAPPADFKFYENGQEFKWPVPPAPKPEINIAEIVSEFEAFHVETEARIISAKSNADALFDQIKADSDAKFEQYIAQLKAKA